ncbi:MAG TPA: PD-(D/E)XK nuclease family protein [Mariprofundaceae bacterium]|nr:PD-(D/E)XK nuclease family protein [Mariprofundaceae bacterium]
MIGIAAADVAGVLEQGSLLLASTPKLASDWKRRLVAAADGIVATPRVESWPQWLAGLARGDAGMPAPFTALQELQLWERIIGEDMPAAGRTASGLARHARDAYALIREFHIDVRELDGAGGEAEALARWIAAMRRIVEREGRTLAADVPELLLPRIASLVSIRHILLDGFDRFTPVQQALLQALHGHGTGFSSIAAEDTPPEMTLTVCADAEAEYRHLARRIAACIEADAHARIAVVTSRQASDAETLRRILDEALLPGPEAAFSMQAVDMTGGPLADQPLVCQSLALLGLAGRNGARLSELAPLLFSHGIRGFAAERMARAQFDARLRGDNRYYIGFGSLLNQPEMQAMPKLAEVVRLLADWDSTARPASEWVRSVHALLQEMGFLQVTAAGRSGSEIRQLNAFRESLASLVAVDAIHDKLEWGAFLSLLSSECRRTPFAQPVRYPQVSVVPLEQIAGLRFDRIFAVAFDEDALPLPAQPSSLLPFSVQRHHALPCATPALAFEASEFLWQRLGQAAPRLHISFAHSRDERELNVSPLLAGMVAGSPEAEAEAQAAHVTEHYGDAPPVPLGPDESVSGGSDIIRNQSACPFRAFATHRLALAPLGETRPGIEPREKGSLIHHALQHIWEELKSQQALLALDEEAAASLIEAAIDHAWGKVRMAIPEATRDYERQRMAAVLHDWLDVERERPPFEVVCCEKPYSLRLPSDGEPQFTVRLKADRIDRDGDGRKILIDYKTGQKQTVGKWIGERMEQPQLPLYSMAEGLGAGDAVCFARVRSGECGFEGLSGEKTGIGGIDPCDGRYHRPDDWPQLLASWKESIDALAGEFVRGRSEVAPRDANACGHCGLEAVCRIDEIGFAHDVDEDDEGDGA